MAIVLDHTIVPAHDNEASARFVARIFGLDYKGSASHFARRSPRMRARSCSPVS